MYNSNRYGMHSRLSCGYSGAPYSYARPGFWEGVADGFCLTAPRAIRVVQQVALMATPAKGLGMTTGLRRLPLKI